MTVNDLPVDLGSWAAFTPSLSRALLTSCLAGAAGGGTGTGGATLVLTAPAPVVDRGGEPRPGLWDRLRRRRPLPPSPEAPGLVLRGRGEGVELTVPRVDAHGFALLAAADAAHLRSLGWEVDEDRAHHLAPTAAEAAEETTRVLIEVLRVPHPADLDAALTP